MTTNLGSSVLCMFLSCCSSYVFCSKALDRTAVEALLESDFKPKRTVVLAYGIDEERGGVVVRPIPILTKFNSDIMYRVLLPLGIIYSLRMAKTHSRYSSMKEVR